GLSGSPVTFSTFVGGVGPVATITVTPPTSPLAIGSTVGVTATLKEAAGTTITGVTVSWSTSSAPTATVASSGATTATLSGIAAGPATITATAPNGITGTALIDVQFRLAQIDAA